VTTSAPEPRGEARLAFLQALSQAAADGLAKPEDYVMTRLRAGAPMTFAGTPAPACLVELHNIGTLTPDRTAALSATLCRLVHEHLGVEPRRTYVGFYDVQPHLWGWDGETFA